MSRETVRMVREGRRPVVAPLVVVGDEPDRDELLARLMRPPVWVYPGDVEDGIGCVTWEDEDGDHE